jgi:hypothetical protein
MWGDFLGTWFVIQTYFHFILNFHRSPSVPLWNSLVVRADPIRSFLRKKVGTEPELEPEDPARR